MTHDILLFLHLLGACTLLGTGAGIAFFMVMASRTGDPALIAHTSGIVVLADTIFTATAVVLQPVTGYLLARDVGWPLWEGWLLAALGLYVVTGLFWLPVVWIQIRLRDIAALARDQKRPLPETYHRLYRVWFACGFPAFTAVLGIVWLMVAKPTF